MYIELVLIRLIKVYIYRLYCLYIEMVNIHNWYTYTIGTHTKLVHIQNWYTYTTGTHTQLVHIHEIGTHT